MLSCRYELPGIAQDLYSTDPTVQIQPRKHVLRVYHADKKAPTRQHELDHTGHTDQEYIYLSALKRSTVQ